MEASPREEVELDVDLLGRGGGGHGAQGGDPGRPEREAAQDVVAHLVVRGAGGREPVTSQLHSIHSTPPIKSHET